MDTEFWFSKKEKKFLHNIDTFYFSVKLADDFTDLGNAANVEQLRRVCNKYSGMANETPFREVEYDSPVLYRKGKYGFFYTFWLESPEQFDFLFAPVVPVGAETVASVTSEIIVQIRARMLWELGAKLAFDKAMEFVRAFCNRFDLTIAEVKENRTDFCWHTNALQDPEHYLNIERFKPMCVCRFPAASYRYQLKHDDEYENDYMSLGNRGDKCFVRIYLKTKEVVEQGYKGWFLYTWFFNGMISRYDLYVLEKAYQKKNWNYVDVARLEFALENDDSLSDQQRREIKELVDVAKYNYQAISKLADKYTPRITKILNIEYQVMRRMSKSFVLLELKENTGVEKRIYDFLDNRRMITQYLTHDTLRLVDRKTDSNKSRCEYTDFWNRLRNTKIVDVVINKKQLKLVRDYTSKLDMEVRKTKALRAVSSFALQLNKDPERSIYEDTAELLAVLNDNDMHKLHNYKHHRVLQLKPDDDTADLRKLRHIRIMNEDGEFYEDS